MALGALDDAVLLLLSRCFLGPGEILKRVWALGVLCVRKLLSCSCDTHHGREIIGKGLGRFEAESGQKNGKQSTKHIELWLLICWRLVL